MWTCFWDMHSGGRTKEEPYEKIYIEAPEAEAKVIFYNRFGHNPERVSCTCCGLDYSISEAKTLAQASGYHRHCQYDGKKYVEKWDDSILKYCNTEQEKEFHRNRDRHMTVKEYNKQKDVLVIRASEIKAEERIGDVPQEGYVWV